ncbi:hypothetical protein Tcan_01186, partial [Toxocara canis]
MIAHRRSILWASIVTTLEVAASFIIVIIAIDFIVGLLHIVFQFASEFFSSIILDMANSSSAKFFPAKRSLEMLIVGNLKQLRTKESEIERNRFCAGSIRN